MRINILMVCLGNICRSPMAEGLMIEKGKKYNLNIHVDSAGFEAFHTGDAPDERAINTMKKHGYNISHLRSRTIKKEDFIKFDKIYIMDKYNLEKIKHISSHPDDLQKVDFIYNAIEPESNKAVDDPYYGNISDFENTYQILDKATEIIAQKLSHSN